MIDNVDDIIDDYEGMFGMNTSSPEEFVATAGEPFDLTTGPISSEGAIIEALHTIYDPELPVDIYELGLIYEIDIKSDGSVNIEMSLTAPNCPVAGEMPNQVARTVAEVFGVGEVEVRLVWEPMWTPDRMSDDAKLILNVY